MTDNVFKPLQKNQSAQVSLLRSRYFGSNVQLHLMLSPRKNVLDTEERSSLFFGHSECTKCRTLFGSQGLPTKNIFGCFNQSVHYHEKNMTIFWGRFGTSKKIHLCVSKIIILASKMRKLASLGAHCAQAVRAHYLSFWNLNQDTKL